MFQAAHIIIKKPLMKKTKSKLCAWVLTIGSLAISSVAANAQNNPNYAPGDLVMFFQQYGGSNTIYANLGNATTWRGAATGADVANSLNFLNINTQLTTAFGSNWATDTSLYAGMAGVRATSEVISHFDGDPRRTIYVSAARAGIGTIGSANSSAYSISADSTFTSVAGAISTMNNVLENSYTSAVAVSPTSTSQIDDRNPFLNSTTQGTAFGAIPGGIQQQGSASSFGTFDAVSAAEFVLDLYRIAPYSDIAGQVGFGEIARLGTYEGSFALDGSGNVSFIGAVPEPSTYALIALTGFLYFFVNKRRKANP